MVGIFFIVHVPYLSPPVSQPTLTIPTTLFVSASSALPAFLCKANLSMRAQSLVLGTGYHILTWSCCELVTNHPCRLPLTRKNFFPPALFEYSCLNSWMVTVSRIQGLMTLKCECSVICIKVFTKSLTNLPSPAGRRVGDEGN